MTAATVTWTPTGTLATIPDLAWASDLGPVSLEEINDAAALQQRVDRKYLVSPATWANVVATLPQRPRVLEIDGVRAFRYASTYYDTPEWESYRAAAHKRPSRYKVRTRSYLDTGTTAVEVKLRSRTGDTVKYREFLEGAVGRSDALSGQALDFVSGFPGIAAAARELGPVLTTRYLRTTMLTADARVTVDSNVTGIDADGRAAAFADCLIVETKSQSRAGTVDRALWGHGVRPAKVSKYCTSLAALHPELPHNRWSRTLRGHVSLL
ncbi:polyphosphate polymerase domain-containing protein [Demequina sediminicola]|uniref:polyphosphate polymerase domain-containing protein n=1 Tax=Demequina sediminicola TaxID=1095026 RepID=UPI000ADC8040|nr:polyphosphate polymerase domain-containing protein [Demequina sediminicola]